MNYDLYLLYAPNQGGWGVFDSCTCPDPGAFPNYMYRKYQVPSEKQRTAFKVLMEVKEDLVIKNIIPTKENERKIFPELTKIISGS